MQSHSEPNPSNEIRTGVLKIHRNSGPMIWDSVGVERRYSGRRNVLNLASEEGTIFLWGKTKGKDFVSFQK